MCVQEVIGKSVKQAVFLPLYTAPDRYGLKFFKYSVLFTSFLKVVKFCFFPIFVALKTRHAFLNFHLCM